MFPLPPAFLPSLFSSSDARRSLVLFPRTPTTTPQPAVATRKEGRFVSLPESLDSLLAPEPDLEAPPLALPALDGASSPPPPGSVPLPAALLAGAPAAAAAVVLTAAEEADLRGRIAIYCLADGFDMKALASALEARGSAHLTHRYEEAIAGHFIDIRGSGLPVGDCFYFEYGCLVCWVSLSSRGCVSLEEEREGGVGGEGWERESER